MTLLITVFASLASTIVWYTHSESKMKIGTLCLMYWGASLMWLVDAIVEYIELGAKYFTPQASDMLNDAYLGFTVAALGLVIWLAVLLVKDPEGKIKAMLAKNQ